MKIPAHDRNADILVPYTFGNGKIARNRISLAPMTNRQSSLDGSLGDDELRWLTSRAEGGFGILITCAAHISRQSQGWANELGIFDDRLLPGLRQSTASVQGAGALAIIQINHAESRAPSALTGRQPVSASTFNLDIPGFEVPREITTAEINTVIADFGAATRRAHDAGFDGVELQGANGYLLTQFISTATNRRGGQQRVLRRCVHPVWIYRTPCTHW